MSVRLTQTVQKGGCAAKISAEVLRSTLSRLDFSTPDPAVLIDGKHFDDAGIYKINSEIALVQTLDFFTPIVDTPSLFGRIAATNALSDVYAMGGTPKTAMAILAFPLATLDPEIMREVMEGALAQTREAHCAILGGHSIDDETLKFGLSVTGFVHPDQIWTNQGARPGDQLVLTKPLGTGTLCAGLKNGDYQESDLQDAIESMCQLNQILPSLSSSQTRAIHAATDITGFGILGHALQMARASQVGMALRFPSIPLFEKTLDSLKKENFTKAHRSNRAYTESQVQIASKLGSEESLTLFDPQTSGGLLLSVAQEEAENLVQALRNRFPSTQIIGEVRAQPEVGIQVHD